MDMAEVKRALLTARGVRVDALRPEADYGFVYDPPEEGDERVWAHEHFRGRWLEYVDSDEELFARLSQHQSALIAA